MPASRRVLARPSGLWMKQPANIRRTGTLELRADARPAGKQNRFRAARPPFAKEIKRFRAICSDAKREAQPVAPLTYASYGEPPAAPFSL